MSENLRSMLIGTDGLSLDWHPKGLLVPAWLFAIAAITNGLSNRAPLH